MARRLVPMARKRHGHPVDDTDSSESDSGVQAVNDTGTAKNLDNLEDDQGLVSVPFWVYWTSPKIVAI